MDVAQQSTRFQGQSTARATVLGTLGCFGTGILMAVAIIVAAENGWRSDSLNFLSSVLLYGTATIIVSVAVGVVISARLGQKEFSSPLKLTLGVLITFVGIVGGSLFHNHEAALLVPAGGAVAVVGLLFVKGWRLVGVGMVVGFLLLLLLSIVYVFLGAGVAPAG